MSIVHERRILLPHHRENLRASGLTDATIEAAGITSETDRDKLALILRMKSYPKNRGAAIVFPYVDRAGTTVLQRVRPDFPGKDGGKYLQPAGTGTFVYFPPAALAAVETPSATLVVTEGEKKSLAATQFGFPCLGLAGVDCWHAKRQIRLLPELEAIDWRNRTVYIAFDSDAVDNENVRANEIGLGQQIQLKGAHVKTVRIPAGPEGEKQGLDDFLARHDAAAFSRLLGEAQELESVNTDELKAPASTMEPATEIDRYLESSRVDGVYRLRFWRGSFWLWQKGRYVELKPSEVSAHLCNHLNERYTHLTCGTLANAAMQLRAKSLLSGTVEMPAWLGESTPDWPAHEVVAAKNGLIHLPSLGSGNPNHFMPPTPRFFSPVALDYDFIIDAPKPVEWYAFLNSIWSNDAQCKELLQEWFGLCLTLDTSFQKILMAVGPKRSGKSTVGRVLQELVGKRNCAGPTLAGMATNFGLWPLLGKTVAIVSDARLGGRTDQAIVVERLLSISGEDSITIDRKQMEPVTGKLLTRLMIISNELPRLLDSSGALASRMLILPFRTSFYGKEDRALTAKLMEELPGILWWSIYGWMRLVKRGYFVQPDSGKELLGELEDLSSPIAVFLKDECKFGSGEYRVPVSVLFQAWKEWTEVKGWKDAGTEQTFGKALRAAVTCLNLTQPRDGNGKKVRTYTGIRLRRSDED